MFEYFFDNLSKKIKVSLRSDRIVVTFTWRGMYLYDNILLSASYSENVSDNRCRENQSTQFMFNP